MQVSNPNDIKIYNLSVGKSLPEWLSDRAKRNLLKKDIDVRRRIELIQDFEMPAVSNCIQVTPDKQYILVTGMYKPRVKCYDVNQLSLKFDRGMDEEVAQFQILSEDYSKMVFLQVDRFVEIHAQDAKYYRLRLPRVCRDFRYHKASCDLYFVGKSDEIYRLNLEQGKFVTSLQTDATYVFEAMCFILLILFKIETGKINCCDINPVHDLFTCGTTEGVVECWDPRTRRRAAKLDCGLSTLLENDIDINKVPAITQIKHRDALNMAVGTSTGHILMYDIRSNKPLIVKDHNYGLPIKSINFHNDLDLVLTSDTKILKLWHRNTGQAYTSIEPGTDLNTSCTFPDSGLIFMTNDAPKVLAYYIPALGAAPKWCSFLDNLTEELEEDPEPTVYDDYKFVTRTELESLHLSHLIGSKMLRAYMHGYFMDVRLYNKAKSIIQPFKYDEYKKAKIKEKIEKEREERVKIKKLPSVNKALAEKLTLAEQEGSKKEKERAETLLKDDRFSKIFKDPAFQVDEESEEYRLLNPVVSKLDKKKKKNLLKDQFEEVDEEESEESSDDDRSWAQEVKKQYREISKAKKGSKLKEKDDLRDEDLTIKKTRLLSLKDNQLETDSREAKRKRKLAKKTLGELMEEEGQEGVISQRKNVSGNIELTFSLKKNKKDEEKKQAMKEHRKERQKIRRSAGHLKGKSNFWKKA